MVQNWGKSLAKSADHCALQPTFQLLLKPKPIHYLFSEMDYDTAVESYLMIWLFNNNKTRIAQTAVVISVWELINFYYLFTSIL